MKTYNFSEYDKLVIVEGGLDYTCYFCHEHGVYLKYKGIDNNKCPWCGQGNDPIENIRELRKKFRKELEA